MADPRQPVATGPGRARKRIVLTTVGSLGDLHPYIAIALGLKARGHDAVVATGEC
jgi:UDP:flavonoid glycosyltransferase YjiC (YdhE family)